MYDERTIALGDDGVFSVPLKGVTCYLIYDGTGEGRWLLSYSNDVTGADHLLSIHSELDDGLLALAHQGMLDEDRFLVRLSNGQTFARPGKVPAEQIMAAHGYLLARSILAFAVIDPVHRTDAVMVRAEVEARLRGRPVHLGEVEPIGEPDTGWCCDVRIPFEGYIHEDLLAPLAHELLDGTGMEVTSIVECTDCAEVAANSADVIQAFPRAA